MLTKLTVISQYIQILNDLKLILCYMSIILKKKKRDDFLSWWLCSWSWLVVSWVYTHQNILNTCVLYITITFQKKAIKKKRQKKRKKKERVCNIKFTISSIQKLSLNRIKIRKINRGTPGWLSGWAPAFSSGRDPQIRDWVSHWAPC